MANDSTPRSKLADATRGDGHPITDRDNVPIVDRHGADLEPGTIVGDYRIERKIGHGGMGSVYEAIHPIIEKRVAIKVLLPQLSQSEEAVERFKSEARAVNRIRHPSIVDVFGYGTTEDGRCFLVMELLDGESLGRRLQYDAPSVAEACDILMSMTHALDAAHATGIVHRDLKPDNVFLVEGKHVKLLDFGIAKLTTGPEDQRAATDYTQPGQAMGTPRYIAPEQARGDPVDGRTDIYSLGVMAFELLTGRLPFVGDNAMELVAKHITLPPPTPSDLAPTLPPVADELLLQMLDKNPVNRPTLGVVREKLDEIRAPWVTSITSVTAMRKLVTASAVAAPAKRGSRVPLFVGAGLAASVASFLLVRGLARDDEAISPAPIAVEPPTDVKSAVTNENPPASSNPAVPETKPPVEAPKSIAPVIEKPKPGKPKLKPQIAKPVVATPKPPDPVIAPPVVAPVAPVTPTPPPKVDETRDRLKSPKLPKPR